MALPAMKAEAIEIPQREVITSVFEFMLFGSTGKITCFHHFAVEKSATEGKNCLNRGLRAGD